MPTNLAIMNYIEKFLNHTMMDIPDYTDPCSGHIDPSKNGFGSIICQTDNFTFFF